MPRRYHAESYKPAPRWLSIWDTFYSSLAPHSVAILQPTGFYETFDVELRSGSALRTLAAEERTAIESIATALTAAAHCSHETPGGVVCAWLERIAKQPNLLRSRDVPPEAHWAIASNYCRAGEPPATHLQDVLGRRRVRFQAPASRPTASNISKAARRARLQQRRPRGRPRNIANRMLAESLSRLFIGFGGRIVRRQMPVDVQGGGVLYIDCGPFLRFLEMVIGPLQTYLQAHGFPGVTIETIERIACEQFV